MRGVSTITPFATSLPRTLPCLSTSSTVLILGARGRFGLAAARAFAQAGWQVLAQVRPGAQRPGHSRRAVDAPSQPQDTAALAAAAQGAAVVVHALEPGLHPQGLAQRGAGLTQAAIAVSRTAGRHAHAARQRLQLRRGACRPCCAKTRRRLPTTFKGRMRIAAKQRPARPPRTTAACRPWCIRAGDFFGSGTGSWLDLVMAKDLRPGRFT